MLRADALEQVFIERKAGAFEILMVLESEAGSRERVSITAPGVDEAAAMAHLIGYLRQNGYGLARKVRVRRSRGGQLSDAPELVARLNAALGSRREGAWK